MRPLIPLAAAGLLGACTVQSPATDDSVNASGTGSEATAGTMDPLPAAPIGNEPAQANGASATNSADGQREVVSEAPFTATSAQGAANVVQTYYALIEAKKYAQAHQLWGSASELADSTFAAPYRQYREYHAEVGKPGEIEGATGSLYVEVPIRTYGVTSKGEKFEEPGTVTLRRVNDVDGSTAEQRRWHITKIDLPPSPH